MLRLNAKTQRRKERKGIRRGCDTTTLKFTTIESKVGAALCPFASLRLTGLKLGMLINFGAAQVKDGIQRVVNGL